MYYALLLVCLASTPDCDAEHAIWAEQSAPLFSDLEECYAAARAHLRHHWPEIRAIEPDAELKAVAICTQAQTEL